MSNLTDATGRARLPVRYCAMYMPGSSRCLSWGADPTTYTWSSVLAGTLDVVAIPPSQLQPGSTLAIGVLATTPDSSAGEAPAPSTFDVIATTSGATTALPVGLAVPGVVGAGMLKYYRFDVKGHQVDIIIVAELITSSVELYVSEGTVNTRPGPGNATWNATRRGGFVSQTAIYIPWTNLSSACTSSPIGRSCSLFIGVRGWQGPPVVTAEFTVRAGYAGSPLYPQQLQNGVAITDGALSSGYQYYAALLDSPGNPTLYLTVANAFGYTETRLNMGPNKTFATATSVTPPDFFVGSIGGFASITVRPQDLSALCTPNGPGPGQRTCPMYLSVRAANGADAAWTVRYTIGASYSQLLDDVPLTTQIPGAPDAAYFIFAVNDPSADILLLVTQLSGGVDVYVSVQSPSAPEVFPSFVSSQWRFAPASGQPGLLINHTDAQFCRSADGRVTTAPCVLAITVASRATTPAAVEIRASVFNGAAVYPLSDGAPQAGRVVEDNYAYYYFQASFTAPPPVMLSMQAYSECGDAACVLCTSMPDSLRSATQMPPAVQLAASRCT